MIEIAIVLLKLPNGHLVVQRRDDNAPTSPNMLGLFGGTVELEETPLDAIERELKEETSLDIPKLKLVHEISKITPSNIRKSKMKVKAHLFSANIDRSDFELYEGVGAEVYEIKKLLKRSDLAPAVSYLLKDLPLT